MPITEIARHGLFGLGRETKTMIEQPATAWQQTSGGPGDALDPILTLPRYFSPREAATLSGEYGEQTQLWLRLKQQAAFGFCLSLFLANLMLMLWLLGSTAVAVLAIIYVATLLCYIVALLLGNYEITRDNIIAWLIGLLPPAGGLAIFSYILNRIYPCPFDPRLSLLYVILFVGVAGFSVTGAFYWAREIYDENLPYPPWVQAFMPALRAYARRLEQADGVEKAGHHHILVNRADSTLGYIPLPDFYEILLAARKPDDPQLVPGRNLLRAAFDGAPRLRDGTELGPGALAEWLNELTRLGIISEPNLANRRYFIMPPPQAIVLLRQGSPPPTLSASLPETGLPASQAKSSQAPEQAPEEEGAE